MTIAADIELAKRRGFDRCEAIVAEGVAGLLPPAPGVAEDERDHAAVFVQWCNTGGVRYCPAKPVTVAAFIFGQSGIGVDAGRILDQVRAIEALHDHYGFPNPVATYAARSALASIISVAPPRSWRKDEKLLFAQLPPEVRAVIGRRVRAQEIALRSAQNAAAEAKRQSGGADKSAKTHEAHYEHSQA